MSEPTAEDPRINEFSGIIWRQRCTISDLRREVEDLGRYCADIRETALEIGDVDHTADAATMLRQLAAQRDEARDRAVQLIEERDDHKARLAVEAFTALDADYDTMVDSLQARIADLHATIRDLGLRNQILARLRAQAVRVNADPCPKGEALTAGPFLPPTHQEAARG